MYIQCAAATPTKSLEFVFCSSSGHQSEQHEDFATCSLLEMEEEVPGSKLLPLVALVGPHRAGVALVSKPDS